jgi:ADP-ribosylglycohydrolase/fructose-1,6-bisphosphatase/inositol monophosphatase family enzyme
MRENGRIIVKLNNSRIVSAMMDPWPIPQKASEIRPDAIPSHRRIKWTLLLNLSRLPTPYHPPYPEATMTPTNSSTRSYDRALQVAIEAAQVAGERLRSEFHRPGGARGSNEHAEVDAEVEAVIRQQLVEAFPKYGVRGEELRQRDRTSRDEPHHLWLIDPNDGTATFLQGGRGAAVSIALLRASVPVLGVVYAFAAPDDTGDLFAWAEGCGGLRRNGVPVERSNWAGRLDVTHTVLLSQDGDRNSRANAMLVAPARFRTVPSIAYRLALVAAGEAEVAISLGDPCEWDYAAGHALLRSVGGELFDVSGVPITYAIDGQSDSGGRCFGGSAMIAPQLANQNWNTVFQLQREKVPYPLIEPRRGQTVADAGLLSRAQGCWLGQLAGDALGSLVEFQDARSIQQRYPQGVRLLANSDTWHTLAGQPTDDSELALMLARSLVQTERFVPSAIAAAYAYWYRSHPFDLGGTTQQALSAISHAINQGSDPIAAAQQSVNAISQSNGGLMRISPLALFGHAVTDAQLAEWARIDAQLTHPHPVCQDANALFVVAVRHALTTGNPPRAVYEYAKTWATQTNLRVEVQQWLAAAATQPPEDYSTQMGWVKIALQNAFYQLLHAPSLEEGVINTVIQGGDSDTNGAIVGALLGAVYGYESLPWQWRDRILSCRPMEGLTGVKQPRPRSFWPIDALQLAERLLALGREWKAEE